MNCRVVVEAAVPVYDVGSSDEAVRIAISKTGKMLNPDLNYVEINMGERTSPSGEELPPAFIAADEALVALELEMTVFNVEREEHASRIARKEIGQLLKDIPLDVLEIEVLEDDEDDEDDDEDDETETTDESEASDDGGDEDDHTEETDSETTVTPDTGDADDEVLPEFEELIDE
ncbi:DUF555 domain-containing protein [Halovenus rubra]|uniref:UPF0212 protein ACFQJ7_06395 n=2 Tax=Halovenus rubra TaxID=869890 RepID=A0ABD5X6K7_9EURY|nr:DUF555 domain-containing protein [Halovenus rubra]